MKARKTFRSLSRELSLPAGVLNRYVNGYVLPKASRAEGLLNFFVKSYLPKIVEGSRIKGSKFIVTSGILSQPFLLNVVSYKACRDFGEKVSLVLTAAVDGIPVAQAVAGFLGVRFAYAKLTQEFSASEHYASKNSSFKPVSSPFYLPKNLLKRSDSVLIVDDVVRGGDTFEALTSICDQAKARISGVFAVFMTLSAYRRLKKKHRVGCIQFIDS